MSAAMTAESDLFHALSTVTFINPRLTGVSAERH